MSTHLPIDFDKAKKAYGTIKAWSDRLEVPYTTVIGWRDSGAVPRWRLSHVSGIAREDGKDIFGKAVKAAPKRRTAA